MKYEYNRDRVIRAALKGVFKARPEVRAILAYSGDMEDVFAGPTRDSAVIIKALATSDDEAIHFIDKDGDSIGWIRLIHDYGANPAEIMQNWTENLEENGAFEEVDKITDKLFDTWGGDS